MFLLKEFSLKLERSHVPLTFAVNMVILFFILGKRIVFKVVFFSFSHDMNGNWKGAVYFWCILKTVAQINSTLEIYYRHLRMSCANFDTERMTL